jgi:hypothetical protein
VHRHHREGRRPPARVEQVAVRLTHEQALVDYGPNVIAPEQILGTLRDLGYDPRKLRRFEEEEPDLVREGKRLLAAIGPQTVDAFNIMSIPTVVLLRDGNESPGWTA